MTPANPGKTLFKPLFMPDGRGRLLGLILCLWAALLCTGPLVGCSSDDGGGDNTAGDDAGMSADAVGGADGVGADGAGSDDGAGDDGAGGETCDETGKSTALLSVEEWFFVAEIATLDQLQVAFDGRIVAGDDALLTFELYALDSATKLPVSNEPTARLCNVPVDADGKFTLNLGTIVIPGAGNPAGIDVDWADAVMEGTIRGPTDICGTASGSLPLLDIDLTGSAFAAVPKGEETEPPASSCAGAPDKTWTGIETCPALVAGSNTFLSAELDREFDVYLPSGATATDTPLPVVFLFHGLGGDRKGIVGEYGFDELVDEGGFILVVPEGANNPDGSRYNGSEWAYLQPRYGSNNRDLVFFDDMLKCVGETWSVDSERVYATGMSAGGLWTTFLSVSRPDVIAAAAPYSGGFQHTFPSDISKVPFMVTWGGENDEAYDLDFHALSLALQASLDANSHFYIHCNHGQEHEVPKAQTPATWDFLSRFTLSGDKGDPFSGTLPESYPSYCSFP